MGVGGGEGLGGGGEGGTAVECRRRNRSLLHELVLGGRWEARDRTDTKQKYGYIGTLGKRFQTEVVDRR